jgi:iron complex transport system ATP-binding protein
LRKVSVTENRAPEIIIEGRKVSVGYGRAPDVVRGVDMAIRNGRTFCLVGPTGAGKSTLLAVLAGIVPPRSGDVLLSGRPLNYIHRRERARRIGYLPQIVRPSISYTVYELVALGRYPHSTGLGFESEADRAAIWHAMTLTHTQHLATRHFNEISGGERQRVLIASVLSCEPEVILLDEPTASLDITRGADVFAALEELAGTGRAVGVVTHDLNLAGQFADEVALISRGEIIADGPPASVLTEDRLSEAYGDGFTLVPRPGSDVPAVLPDRKARGK